MPQTSPEIVVPETDELKKESLALVTAAKAITIRNHDEYSAAGRELVRVANVRKGIVFAFKEAKAAAFDAHRKITKLEGDLLAYPTEAERLLKAAMGTFLREEDARRRKAEAEERARLMAAEQKRQDAEAEALFDAGEHEEAVELISQPVLAPVVELARPTAEGVTSRKQWGYRINDPNRINDPFKIVNEKKIGQTVRALGPDARAAIGEGIEIFEETVMSVRTN